MSLDRTGLSRATRAHDRTPLRRQRCRALAREHRCLETSLHTSVTHRFADAPTASDVERYLDALHVTELALACACRAGDEPAWEHFIRGYRPGLYAAARAVAGDEGRDLADGLYASSSGSQSATASADHLFSTTTDAAD